MRTHLLTIAAVALATGRAQEQRTVSSPDTNAARLEPASRTQLLWKFTLPPTRLSEMGNPACSEDALAIARRNGLKFADRLSIGSGLAKLGPHEFVGITDRGPNGIVEPGNNGTGSSRTFPLPCFCPTIVRFELADQQIRVLEFIPLKDSHGKLISGLSNVEGEERLYETAEAKTPLPFDPNGVDPEGIRVLPDGNFLMSEEYSPSILVVSPKGQILVRYTPGSKPLPNATYPVKPILPDVFAQRRTNRGFESLALSGDGRFAYALLQSAMGDARDARFHDSRVIRALKLDVSQPFNAQVVGEFLLSLPPAPADSSTQTPPKPSLMSDAEWLAPEKLLVLGRVNGQTRLLVVDFRRATNVLGREDAATLVFEAADTDLTAIGIQTASVSEIFSTASLPGIDSSKLEGLALIGPDEIALANDNDFGLGDDVNGEPSKVWTLRLPVLLDSRR